MVTWCEPEDAPQRKPAADTAMLAPPRPDLRETLLAYLAGHNVLTLATQGDEGPWAAAVYYVSDDFTLYFLSPPTTRHCRNLDHDPRFAATIQKDEADWTRITGVQIEGCAARLGFGESLHAAALYARKFAFADPGRASGALLAAMAKVAWYQLRPDALYLIDNAQGLGHRERLDVG